MATVRLDFIPPISTDIISLKIYESPVKEGPFNEIEEVSVIGEYPNYISTFTTTHAIAIDDWFAIDWFDDKGGHLGMSDPIKGNVQLLLSEIVGRVLVRDPTINENVVYDEAQAVLEGFLPVGTDIEDASVDLANYRERSGLTLLTQARCYLFDLSEGGMKYTVGLVSQEQKESRSLASVKEMLRMAESMMGLSYSTILQMAAIEIGSDGQLVAGDQTRLLVEIQ